MVRRPPGAWNRVVKAALTLIVIAGIAALAGGVTTFRRYVEESPRFCQSCHVIAPEVALWIESEHRTLRCQDCHHQTLSEGVGILRAFVTGNAPGLEHAQVDVRSCADCHVSHDTAWPNIANSRGHVVHVEKGNLACTKCHGQQMHFDRPKRDTCVDCHEDASSLSSCGQSHCLACHNFLTTEEVLKPDRRDCLGCHLRQERPILISDTAAMHFDCSACHRPHSKTGDVACEDCHRPVELVGSHATPGHAKCGDCHEAHDWASRRSQCFECHPQHRTHHAGRGCSECHPFKKGLSTGPR